MPLTIDRPPTYTEILQRQNAALREQRAALLLTIQEQRDRLDRLEEEIAAFRRERAAAD